MKHKKVAILALLLLISILATACQSGWEVELKTQNGLAGEITPDLVASYLDASENEEGIPLAQVFYHYGLTLIEDITLYRGETMTATYDWETTAGGAKISKSGEIVIGDLVAQPSSICVTESPLAEEISLSILDIAPTMAQVLGLPGLPEATGQSQSDLEAEHGVMIVVDGLQYQRLLSMIAQGSLPFFRSLPAIERGLTVFPSITTASTAALLTGAPPYINGVHGYDMRSTEIATLFDHAAEQGLSVTAVEGHGLAFNLRSAEVILSGDRDGDGFTDDNVLANSLDVINTAMPDLLFIHFHDVDDQGHSFGPDSPQYEEAIFRVDSYLSQILDALPSNTFILIFADHGMQADLASNGGNHGQLTKSAMVIPIIFLEK